MTIKPDSRWRPSFEKARGRLLIDKLMAGGGCGEDHRRSDSGGGVVRGGVKNKELLMSH